MIVMDHLTDMMIKSIIVKLERILFNLTGVELPALRKEWENHVERIQFQLDCEHGTHISKVSNIQYGVEL